MTDMTDWNKFLNSGSVFDYIEYCQQKTDQKEQTFSEVHDRRTCDKRE